MPTSTMNPTAIITRAHPNMRSQVAEQLKKIQGITFFSPLACRFDFIELKASYQERQKLRSQIRLLPNPRADGEFRNIQSKNWLHDGAEEPQI
jgi:hypothetical protein